MLYVDNLASLLAVAAQANATDDETFGEVMDRLQSIDEKELEVFQTMRAHRSGCESTQDILDDV